jgi:hypothetical protein
MAKACHDDVIDAMLAKIATGNILTVCSTQPTTRTEAVTTFMLADVVVTAGDGNGDFVIAEGDVSGRKVTITEQADMDIDASDDAEHVAICDGADLLYVTTCTLQGLTSGGTVTVPAFDIEVADPT